MFLDIDLSSELGELEQQLQVSIIQIQKAVSRTLKKTGRWLETHSKREIGVALALPQRVLSVRYYQRFSVKNGNRSVNVWFGLNPIRMSAIGNAHQTAAGVKVGKHEYHGAFIAQMESGHVGVFQRIAAADTRREKRKKDGQWTELPIKEEIFEIESLSAPILERYYARAEARFKQILKQEINYVLKIEKL